MKYTYRLTLDEPYFRTLIARYYQQRPLLLRPPVQFVVAGLVLFVGLELGPFRFSSLEGSIAMLVLYVLAAAFGLYVIRVNVYQKFRYSSYFGKDSVSTILEDGLETSGWRDGKFTEWTMFKTAVRYSDGIMLIRKGVIWWLPNAGLQDATPSDVVRFLSSKLSIRNVA